MKCSMGKACYLAHGWLEIIYHPLLYKTKLCESTLKKEVCSQYGIFCTKAHNESERRNLVTIYGKDWKRHYEAYQTCDYEKPPSKKLKRKRSKRIGMTDYSLLHVSIAEDDFSCMGIFATSELSSQLYGGSPLFVPTPPESPSLDSIGECTEPQESVRFGNFPSIDLNELGHESTFCGREDEMDTEICAKEVKSTAFKELCSSSSVSDNPKGIAFKENGSWSSGSGYQYSLSSATSSTDQDIELCRIKKDTMNKKVIGSGVCKGNNFPDDKMIYRSLQDFDQQDWELKLAEHGYENADILSFCKDELERLVDEKD